MITRNSVLIVLAFILVGGCGKGETTTGQQAVPAETPDEAVQPQTTEPLTEIAPGLSMRILHEGNGDAAAVGQIAVVHYTGWLYDDAADDHRGKKFDSSIDRGEYFSFMLGQGRVIKGWDQGVVGMKVGEKRELTIAPELAYGDRGAGRVIPPGATLVFEVELVGLQGPGSASSD